MLLFEKAGKFLLTNLLMLLITLPLSYSEADAQYFGRNKVQYEDFNFQILETTHFDIYHYPQEETAVKDLGRLSERWYQRHSNIFGHTFKTRNPLIIYANHADFQQNDIIPRVSVGTGGVTEGLRNRVVMPFAEANQSTNHVLGHELVHAFQYDIAKSTDKIGGIRATSQLPLWYIEGMAEYLSVGDENTHTAMWLRDALLQDDLPSIRDLSNSRKYFPYRYGHSVLTYIAGRWGDEVISKLYVATAQKGMKKGIESVLGISSDSLSGMWQRSIRRKYTDDLEQHHNPEQVGKLVLGKKKGTGTINSGPSLSPNGDRVAFISEKNIFSLELFLADAHTGKIIRKLTSTDTDPHMNALRFIESAGTWSPDGTRFAAVVFAKGDNQIIIVDASSGKTRRTLGFGEVDAITNPAWSPGGDRIVFSGSDGGYTDLYMYHLKQDSLVNLTNDKYSDLQPSWSPDGSALAFVTDRGPNTSFENLTFGNMAVALYDLDSGEIEMVPEFYDSKHINPQFAPNGESIYYISDYGGFSNVYRYDFGTRKRYRVTDVNTGVSGISEYSPALTVARETGDLMVTVFENSNYSGYRIPAEETTGHEVLSVDRLADSAELPPIGGSGNRIMDSYLENPVTDLPPISSFGMSDYTPTLRLNNITGGGGLGVSNELGVGAAGGITMQFSDMLNQHRLITSLRMQGSFKDIGGQVAYLNQDHRFVYGASVSHMPFRTSGASVTQDTVSVDGQQVVAPVINRLNRRVFRDRVSLLGMYPFSTTQRLELSTGWTHIWYDLELERTFLNQFGQPFERNTSSLETPSPINMYSFSTAYVEDNSISAFTGPIRGHRLRLELSPTTGSLTYLNALADYRRYFYMRPFTLAFRAMHTGRYLQDSEDDRLTPNFIGYESLVRGYNSNSFSAAECRQSPGEGCAVFNRLIGSRMAVSNLEFRIPVLGAEPLALFRSNTIPTTFNTFFDAGYAWTKENPFSFDDLKWTTSPTAERVPVFSTGASVRMNVLGYLIAELYYAVPFQRPNKNGYIGFTISQGW